MTENASVKNTPSLNLGRTVAWCTQPSRHVSPIASMEEINAQEPLSPRDAESRLATLEMMLEAIQSDGSALNRDLGRLEQWFADHEHAPEADVKESLVGRFARWLRAQGAKFQPSITTPEDTKPGDDKSDTPFMRDPLRPISEERDVESVIAVTVFGLAPDALEGALDTVEEYCRKHGTAPVILTDCDRFDIFRKRRMIFEYLPPVDQRDRFAPDLQWPLYFARRFSLYQRKWRPLGIISFGAKPPIEDFNALLNCPAKTV